MSLQVITKKGYNTNCQHIEDGTKGTMFCRQHLPMHFVEWKVLYFDWYFTEVCSWGCNWQSALLQVMAYHWVIWLFQVYTLSLIRKAVKYHYNVVSFLQNYHNRHPIACPWGQGMGCLLWLLTLMHVLLQSLLCWMQNHIILDRIVTAHDCTFHIT